MENVNVKLVYESKGTKINDSTRIYNKGEIISKSPIRVYEFDKPIKKFPIENKDVNWGDRLKDEYKKFIPKEFHYVVVSDAHTHIERLAFLGFKYTKDGEDRYGYLDKHHIDGRLTMMIHGGNSKDIHPDEVYLRRIAYKNGYRLNLIK